MDLRVCLVAVCLFAFAVTFIQGAGIPKCCVKTKKAISQVTLQKIERWEMQQSNGACDIKAAVLHVRGRKKPVCADPNLVPYLRKLARKKRQNKLI